jgi:hypothetical protein
VRIMNQHHLCRYIDKTKRTIRRDDDEWYHSGCCPCRPKLRFTCEEGDMEHRIPDEGGMLLLLITDRYHDLWLTQHNMPFEEDW